MEAEETGYAGSSQRVHTRPEEEEGEEEPSREELEEHPTREAGASTQEEVVEPIEEFSEEP
jgi:hypothetical protein